MNSVSARMIRKLESSLESRGSLDAESRAWPGIASAGHIVDARATPATSLLSAPQPVVQRHCARFSPNCRSIFRHQSFVSSILAMVF
jgi:hypothetical protein